MSRILSNFARGNQRRAPVLKTDTHYFRCARMLRTLHSQNKIVRQLNELTRTFRFVRGCFARCTRKIKRAPAFGQSRLTPLFYQKTLKCARMLRTLHSKNKNVCQYKELHVVFCFARDN